MSLPPPAYVVYDHPRDYPEAFVCRLWLSEHLCAVEPFMVAATLEEIQLALEERGLCNIGRFDGDDPAIREVWV